MSSKKYDVVVFTNNFVGSDGMTYDYHTYMVNGAVARWDDYDYSDPDYHRQMAMETCARHLENGNYCGSFGKYLPLSEVVGQLNVAGFWSGEVVPMSEKEANFASLEILKSICRLECETSDTFDGWDPILGEYEYFPLPCVEVNTLDKLIPSALFDYCGLTYIKTTTGDNEDYNCVDLLTGTIVTLSKSAKVERPSVNYTVVK